MSVNAIILASLSPFIINKLSIPPHATNDNGILCTIEQNQISQDSRQQQEHYDRVCHEYTEALKLPHTQEYMAYMDRKFLDSFQTQPDDCFVEVCCGEGEALKIIPNMKHYVGVDISRKMLEKGYAQYGKRDGVLFIHGDALQLPFKDGSVDVVVMLGGIHHVPNRKKLFQECYRVLKAGGQFIFREPSSDWIVWKAIRKVIYRLSPGLDHTTERPLQYEETVPLLEEVGFEKKLYKNYTFLGFCLFMNVDILKFNKVFQYVPGIRFIVKTFARFDDFVTNLPIFSNVGLQVIGVFKKN